MSLNMKNSGMTLVEMIIGICLLAIVGMTFAVGMSSLLSITNRANQYKIASAVTSTTIELQNVESAKKYVKSDGVNLTYNNTTNTENYYLLLEGTKNGVAFTPIRVYGDYITASDKKEGNMTNYTGLTYKEFLSGNYEYEDPPITGNE